MGYVKALIAGKERQMAPRAPRSLSTFCRKKLPLIQARADGRRLLDTVVAIVETDRWNSFDRFHETTRTLVDRYSAAGAGVEVVPLQTGGRIGSGRWIIHEAADVRSATVDVIGPVRRRVLDYKENPWHVIQWSGATPRNGMVNELVIVDDSEKLERIPPDGLSGKIVLTRLNPRSRLRALAQTGAAGVITDQPVENLPNATAWTKFGWGGIPIGNAAFHLVGLVLSENEGNKLRRLAKTHGSLTLRTKVDIRKYVGTHDIISGLVPGEGRPQEEIWVLAHSGEPGAIDNASGVALCVEIATVLESLIAEGSLPRPKRTIRLLNAYECYGFFKYLEDIERPVPPLGGLNIDSVGAKPKVCDSRLEWHNTIPMSARFVNKLGETIVRSALQRRNPGYKLCVEPFVSTSDTLIGDPKYGFPCPWITTHRQARSFDAYHTSADTPNLLSRPGLALCATAAAGYLYFLANAGSREVVELAMVETESTLEQLRPSQKQLSPGQVSYICEAHRINLEKLQDWVSEKDHDQVLARLSTYERQVREAARSAARRKTQSGRRSVPGSRRVPHRTALLSPDLSNTPPSIAAWIGKARLSPWALFWADGRRTLAEIAEALTCEYQREITLEQVTLFFEAHADLGYVELSEPTQGHSVLE